MRLSTKLSGIVAIGGVAALGAGLISSGGIGATWTDEHAATATIEAGTLTCALSSPTRLQDSIDQHANGGTATISLDPITRSDPGIRTAPLVVTNTGSVPLVVNWSKTETGGLFNNDIPFYSYTIPTQTLAPGASQSANIGFHWDSLENNAQGKKARVKYQITCNETPKLDNNLTPFYREGGSAIYNGTSIDLVTVPGSTGTPTAGVYFDGVAAGSELPTAVPDFKTASGTGSSVPLVQIRMSDGTILRVAEGKVVSSPGASFADNSSNWDDIVSYATSNNITVQRAYIQAQGGTGYTGSITCINYNGVIFGTSESC